MATFKNAVIYQICPRSFANSNGDGIGDLPGILFRLDYLVDLGVDVLWLSPILRRPTPTMGTTFQITKPLCRSSGLWLILTHC